MSRAYSDAHHHLRRSLTRPKQQQGGIPSQYVDPKYSGQPLLNPSLVAQQAQDPNNAAHPQNPNVCGVVPFYGVAKYALHR
jgi:hypothetical protein